VTDRPRSEDRDPAAGFLGALDYTAAMQEGPRPGETIDEFIDRMNTSLGDVFRAMGQAPPQADWTPDDDPTDESLSTARIPVEVGPLEVDLGFRLELERVPTKAERDAIYAAVLDWYVEGANRPSGGVIKNVEGPYPVVDDRTFEWVADLSSIGWAAFPGLIERLDRAVEPLDVRVKRLLITSEPPEDTLESN
jgi:hypothetical protein